MLRRRKHPAPRSASPRTPGALLRDRRGAAAIEFAIILPLLLVFYLGTFEASQAIGAHRKLEAVASTVDDLVSRTTVMNQTRLDNILDISSAIMNPFALDGLTLTVTTVRLTEKSRGGLEAKVDWSRSRGGTARAPGTVFPVTEDLRALGEGYLVVTEARYRHATNFDYVGAFDGLTFSKEYVFRPRKSTEIPWQ